MKNKWIFSFCHIVKLSNFWIILAQNTNFLICWIKFLLLSFIILFLHIMRIRIVFSTLQSEIICSKKYIFLFSYSANHILLFHQQFYLVYEKKSVQNRTNIFSIVFIHNFLSSFFYLLFRINFLKMEQNKLLFQMP